MTAETSPAPGPCADAGALTIELEPEYRAMLDRWAELVPEKCRCCRKHIAIALMERGAGAYRAVRPRPEALVSTLTVGELAEALGAGDVDQQRTQRAENERAEAEVRQKMLDTLYALIGDIGRLAGRVHGAPAIIRVDSPKMLEEQLAVLRANYAEPPVLDMVILYAFVGEKPSSAGVN